MKVFRCLFVSLMLMTVATSVVGASADQWQHDFALAQKVYQDKQYEQALQYAQQLYLWAQKELADNDEIMFQGAYFLAINLHRGNRLQEAQLLYQDALNRSLKRLGAAHAQTQAIFTNLASVYYYQGLMGPLIEVSRDYIEFLKKELGEGHRDLIPYYNGLGEAYRKEKLFDKALPIFEQAYDVAQKNFPAAHEQVLSARFNVALTQLDMGRIEQAEEVFYDILQTVDEPTTKLSVFNNLGHAFEERGDFKEALSFYEEGLKLLVDIPETENSEEAVIIYNNMGELAAKRGDYAAAVRYFEASMRVGQKVLGQHSVNEIYVWQQLAALEEKQGHLTQAEQLHLRAINQAREIMDENNPTFRDLEQGLQEFYQRTR